MESFSSYETKQQFGKVMDTALQEAVTITKHGRPRVNEIAGSILEKSDMFSTPSSTQAKHIHLSHNPERLSVANQISSHSPEFS